MRLLLVEDDREISRMLEGYLANENFDVVCAMDGEEAIRRFGGGFSDGLDGVGNLPCLIDPRPDASEPIHHLLVGGPGFGAARCFMEATLQ